VALVAKRLKIGEVVSARDARVAAVRELDVVHFEANAIAAFALAGFAAVAVTAAGGAAGGGPPMVLGVGAGAGIGAP
jgi:hypothetical protein